MTQPTTPEHSVEFQHVLDEEWSRISKLRKARGIHDNAATVGLALSGGGLRSTAFGLGVAKGLAQKYWFNRVDYVSGVGGGSLAAGIIAWVQREAAPASNEQAVDEQTVLPPAVRRYLADNLPCLASDHVQRRVLGESKSGEQTPSAVSGAALAMFQGVRSVCVYGGLLLGVFFLCSLGDAFLDLLKPALLLLTRSSAWYYVVTYSDFGLVMAFAALLVATARVLAGPARRVVKRAGRVVSPVVPAVGPRTWRGAAWFVACALCLMFALVALFNDGGGWPSWLALGVFGSASVLCARAWRKSWNEAESGHATGFWAYLGVAVTLLSAVAVAVLLWGAGLFYLLASGPHVPGKPTALNPWLGLGFGTVSVAWLLLSAAYFVRRDRVPIGRRGQATRHAYERSLTFDASLAATLSWFEAFLALGAVTLTHRLLLLHVPSQLLRLSALLGVAVAGTALIVVRASGADRDSRKAKRRLLSGIAFERLRGLRWRVLSAVVVFALLLLSNTIMWGLLDSRAPSALILIVSAALLFGSTSELNFTGLSRIYRNRIAEIFLPDDVAVGSERWQPAWSGNEFLLASIAEHRGPYPLFNAGLTTTGSLNARLRNRTADAFILSPLFVGSAATGWASTTDWARGKFTLCDALTTSALSLVPGGRSGELGAAGRLVTSILAILSLRTGTWVPHPKPSKRPKRARPNLLNPGLKADFTGSGHSESEPLVCLSDGRQFDELGLYELLRRGLDVIFVADSTPDPELQHGALGLCLTRAKEDLGIEVTFEEGELARSTLVEPEASAARRRSAHGFAIATIRYPDTIQHPNGKYGTLVYMKPRLLSSMPIELESYAAVHPEFPHARHTVGRVDNQLFYAQEELGLRIALGACEAVKDLFRSSTPPRQSMFTGPAAETLANAAND